MEIKFWVAVSIAIVITGGGALSGLVLIVDSVRVRAGRGPVATLASATALCFVVAVLMAMLIYDAVVPF
jgi:hypothetical protein